MDHGIYSVFVLICSSHVVVTADKYSDMNGHLIDKTITTSTTDAPVVCPAGYTRIPSPINTCYFLEKISTRNWTDAKLACEQNNGYLMALKTSELHNHMKSVILSTAPGCNIYVGGNDRALEGSWTWLDGTPVYLTHSGWWPGQPNNNIQGTEDQDCMLLEIGYNLNFGDIYCSYNACYICQSDGI